MRTSSQTAKLLENFFSIIFCLQPNRMNLKELREKKKISQEELSRQTGIPRARIGKWELGKGNPKANDLKTLEKFFSIEETEKENGSNMVEEAEAHYGQPIIQVVLNLSYIGKKNADSIDKMADSNLLNAKSIATLVGLLTSNSDLAAQLISSPLAQHMPDDLPAEANK
jgi:transcriptional regulator with XRE-family HTH domain